MDVLVFRGDDGLDELTTTTTSSVWEVSGGQVRPGRIDPAALGFGPSSADGLRGGDVEFNVGVARGVFDGEPGPVADAVVLNAAAAIAAYAGLSGDLEADLAAGLERSRAVLSSRASVDLVDRWVAVSQREAARVI